MRIRTISTIYHGDRRRSFDHGLSLTGVVEQVGIEVPEYQIGPRVMVVAPHAQYALGHTGSMVKGSMFKLPDSISSEEGTFLLLAKEATAWVDSSGVKTGNRVVVLGQGIVGSLVMQLLRRHQPEWIITVDALPNRCQLSRRLAADEVINTTDVDPIQVVKDLN